MILFGMLSLINPNSCMSKMSKITLSQKAFEEYKAIYKEQVGGELPSDEKLHEMAVSLLTLMDVVYRPIKKEWWEKHKKKHVGHQHTD